MFFKFHIIISAEAVQMSDNLHNRKIMLRNGFCIILKLTDKRKHCLLDIFTYTDMDRLKYAVHINILRLHGKLLSLGRNVRYINRTAGSVDHTVGNSFPCPLVGITKRR